MTTRVCCDTAVPANGVLGLFGKDICFSVDENALAISSNCCFVPSDSSESLRLANSRSCKFINLGKISVPFVAFGCVVVFGADPPAFAPVLERVA